MPRLIAKKSLGQNFLNSPDIARKIVAAANIGTTDTVLEIGPGEGMLTAFLLEKAGHVVVIEKDHRAIPLLQERFAQEIATDKLKIIEADVLEVDPTQIGLSDRKYKLVANIPYYITGEIMRQFLSGKVKPSSMTIMVQKEVADRIVARDGKESLLSISVRIYGKPTYITTVKPGSFTPSPSIDSAVIHIADISGDFFTTNNIADEIFFKIVRAGFAHKRKLLVSNIAECACITKNKVLAAITACNLKETVRAEEVSIDTWKKIVKYLS